MAGTGQAGPTCAQNNPGAIDDGTLCRTQSPAPGSVSSGWFPSFSSIGNSISSEYQSVKTRLQSSYQNLKQGLRSDYEGARCLYQAARMAEDLAPAAILEETGYKSLLKELISGLIQMLAILGAATFLGATVGGIVGAFFGGVGAAPGAVVGADLGLDLGLAVLTWLGLGFLAVSIAEGFGEMLKALRNGVEWAWYARNLQGAAEEKQVQKAAHELARTVGILVRLILQGILAYLLKKAAMSSTRGAMSTIGKVQADGAAAVSDATVAELVGRLRSSKLGDGFADWVKNNWRDLRNNPKLKPKEAPKLAEEGGGPGSDSSGGNSASKDGSSKPKKDDAPKKTDADLAAERQATAQKFYEKQGWDQVKIARHMKGIDFSQPVEVTTLQPGTTVVQYQAPGDPQGNYYANPGADPSTLGIDPTGKTPQEYVVTRPVQVLQSTANDIPDWRGSGNTWTGGSTQYCTTENSAFQPQ